MYPYTNSLIRTDIQARTGTSLPVQHATRTDEAPQQIHDRLPWPSSIQAEYRHGQTRQSLALSLPDTPAGALCRPPALGEAVQPRAQMDRWTEMQTDTSPASIANVFFYNHVRYTESTRTVERERGRGTEDEEEEEDREKETERLSRRRRRRKEGMKGVPT